MLNKINVYTYIHTYIYLFGCIIFIYFLCVIYYLLFWPHRTACGTLVPNQGLNPVRVTWYINHWTSRKVPSKGVFNDLITGFHNYLIMSSQVLSGKESACNTGSTILIPGLGRSLGEGSDNTLQYSCLGNPMDREAWWATVKLVQYLNYMDRGALQSMGLQKSLRRLSN